MVESQSLASVESLSVDQLQLDSSRSPSHQKLPEQDAVQPLSDRFWHVVERHPYMQQVSVVLSGGRNLSLALTSASAAHWHRLLLPELLSTPKGGGVITADSGKQFLVVSHYLEVLQ